VTSDLKTKSWKLWCKRVFNLYLDAHQSSRG